jgi:uncharacterized membrane protein
MTWLLLTKWLHIVSSTVLFGTGAGIAFFFLRAQRTSEPKIIAAVSREVVLADMIFTATAVVLQPVTGVALARMAGYPLTTPWLLLSFALYGVAGCCWLPVVWLQIRMRDLAMGAAERDLPLSAPYQRYYRWWFTLGCPAFTAVMVIFYLMVAKPDVSLP